MNNWRRMATLAVSVIAIVALAAQPAHAAEGGTNPLVFDPDLFFFSLVVFALVYLVLSKFAWKPIVEGLREREGGVEDDLAAAASLGAAAQQKMAEYDGKLTAASAEVKLLLEEARRQADTERERLLDDATARSQAEKEKALAEIAAAREKALADLRDKSVERAEQLASNLAGREVKATNHGDLVNQSLAEFPQS